MIPLVVVPWFSKQEWLEVYEAAFSDDILRWKDAKDTMIVWQARVNKLPAGIDVTLPLLQAKVIDADPTVDKSVKSILLATALQRFVSSIVKLPQTNYYRTQTMHNLAEDIGLPMHLVDLRNEIVHGSGGWAGGQTIHKAFETAYEWIKGYYWDAELKKMQVNSEVTSNEIPQEKWQRFLRLLKWYASLVIPKSDTAMVDPVSQKKACLDLVKFFEALYPEDPQKCIEAIVLHLLIPETRPNLVQRLQAGTERSCGCFFKDKIISGVDAFISSLHMVDEVTELMFSHLIKKGQEHTKLASEWICLLAGSILGLPQFFSHSSHCRNHKLGLNKNDKVKWKKIVQELLETETEWAANIAIKIMSCPTAGFSESQKKNMEELVHAFNGSSQHDLKQAEKTNTKMLKDGAYTVDNIVEVAQECSESALARVERLKGSGILPRTVVTPVDAPLGVLPHQKDNPVFYKELILHYPDIKEDLPLSKRRKQT